MLGKSSKRERSGAKTHQCIFDSGSLINANKTLKEKFKITTSRCDFIGLKNNRPENSEI